MSENAPRNHEAHKPNHEKIEVSKSYEIHHKNQESEAALSPENARENLEKSYQQRRHYYRYTRK